MNTNTMELNLNEMENVNGGGLWETVAANIALEVEMASKNAMKYEPYPWVVGGIGGLCKGLWKGIFGDK